jgi:MurNAc alpha-1-phosphate uridylyltransferase
MLRTAINQGLIGAQYFTGRWTDVGTPQRLTELNNIET